MEIAEWEIEEAQRAGLTNLVSSLTADQAVQKLYSDNYALREKRRGDKAAFETTSSQVKADLQAEFDDRAAALQLKIDEATAELAKFSEVDLDQLGVDKAELDQLRQRSALNQIAEWMTWSPTVLADMDNMAGGLEYKAGEAGKATVVIDGGEVDLQAYAEENWTSYLPVLTLTKPGSGSFYRSQSSADPGNTKSLAQEFKDAREAQKTVSPLDKFTIA